MTQTQVQYGPRLAARPTGALRRALLVAPTVDIEDAPPLYGEPNAVYARALSELDIMAKTLRYIGAEVTILQPPPGDAYASAAADGAVVFENGAAIMRPASTTRRPFAQWLENQFAAIDVPIAGHVAAPGLLDGSDVIFVDDVAFIGVNKRTNAIGRNGFAQIARAHGFRPIEVALADNVPALRAVAGVCTKDTLVVSSRGIDRAAFSGFRTIVLEPDDDYGAGVLNLGDHHVLADVRYPRAINALRKAGIVVEAIDLYDFGRIGITPSMMAIDLKRI
jgi:N-dimethylarginine dimethylaminohydrolase